MVRSTANPKSIQVTLAAGLRARAATGVAVIDTTGEEILDDVQPFLDRVQPFLDDVQPFLEVAKAHANNNDVIPFATVLRRLA